MKLETEGKDLKELHWMMDMLTNVDVGLVVLDVSYCIQMWNHFMENHSGKRDMEIRNKNVFELFPELPDVWFKHKIDSVFLLRSGAFSVWEQRPYLFKFKNYRPITGTHPYMFQNVSILPLFSADGEVKNVCLLIYDVTDVALGKQQLTIANQELKKLSRTDLLTNLNNRGFWEESIQMEFDRCRRYELVSTLIIFDIDLFKNVNDTFGHRAGDEVIRVVAQKLREAIRTSDVAGRYGGEEFVVFLPNTNEKHAFVFAERFRKAIEGLVIKHSTAEIRFTISLGIREFTKSLRSYEQWIEQADQALYRSKKQGRNKTTTF